VWVVLRYIEGSKAQDKDCEGSKAQDKDFGGGGAMFYYWFVFRRAVYATRIKF